MEHIGKSIGKGYFKSLSCDGDGGLNEDDYEPFSLVQVFLWVVLGGVCLGVSCLSPIFGEVGDMVFESVVALASALGLCGMCGLGGVFGFSKVVSIGATMVGVGCWFPSLKFFWVSSLWWFFCAVIFFRNSGWRLGLFLLLLVVVGGLGGSSCWPALPLASSWLSFAPAYGVFTGSFLRVIAFTMF